MSYLTAFAIAAIITLIVGIAGYSLGRKKAKEYEEFNNARLEEQRQNLLFDINELSMQRTEILTSIEQYREEFEKERERDRLHLEEYIQEKREIIDQQIKSEFELSREKLKQNLAEFALRENSQLEESLQKNREEFESKMTLMRSQMTDVEKELADLLLKRAAAVADAKRNEEMKTEEKFYMLQLSGADLEDIKELKMVERRLSKKEVLNKLVYKVYFEKPYTDLIGRVVGKETKTGIYKITNTLNQKVYIGQAVNIAERWKQHIKRALGAEPMTQNKLYPAMAEEGVWNFTFEIIEECEKSKLSEREQYWQKFFGAKEYGYSIK